MRAQEDTEFRDFIIDSVEPVREPGAAEGSQPEWWEVAFFAEGEESRGGLCFLIPNGGVEPKPGMTMRQWPGHFGQPVRGVALDGHVIYYRSEEEERARNERESEAHDRREREAWEQGGREEQDARLAKLPAVFRRRVERFRSGNPEFRWRYEGYELFVCEEAVKLAERVRGLEDTDGALSLLADDEEALEAAGLSDEHSGNTFMFALGLAALFARGDEDGVVDAAGALTPLVGAEAYGDVPLRLGG